MRNLNSLISRAQNGDTNAFNAIVVQFQDMALKYAFSFLRDFQLAQDVAQEAFIGAFQDLPNLRSPEAFVSWFRRIIFTRCDRLTRRKHYKTLPLEEELIPSPNQNPLDQLELNERDILLLKAIRSLPYEERSITILFYLNQRSHFEISQSLNIPTYTVNNRLRRARKRLKKKLILFHQANPYVKVVAKTNHTLG